jgi:lyso-ornithine lipid O-acyltransferase
MKYFRRLYRISGLVFWFFIMTFYAFYFHITFTIKGKSKQDLIKRLSYAAIIWGKGLSWILGLHIKTTGNVDSVNGIVVSNHLGYLDILTLSSVFPIRFTPKKEIASWPLLGWFIRISLPIWIDRKSKQASINIAKSFSDTVKNGTCLLLFPEGTTTDGKHGLLPFKSAAFEAAAKENITLSPVLIRYIEKDKVPICWFGNATLITHIWNLFGQKRIDAELRILNPIKPDGKDRKSLSKEIQEYMEIKYKEVI